MKGDPLFSIFNADTHKKSSLIVSVWIKVRQKTGRDCEKCQTINCTKEFHLLRMLRTEEGLMGGLGKDPS